MCPANCRAGFPGSSFATSVGDGQSLGASKNSKPIRTGGTSSYSTNISTGTTARDWARATRQDGPGWFASCCSRAENEYPPKDAQKRQAKPPTRFTKHL